MNKMYMRFVCAHNLNNYINRCIIRAIDVQHTTMTIKKSVSLKIRSRKFKANLKKSQNIFLYLKFERNASFLHIKFQEMRGDMYNNHRVPHTHTHTLTDVRHKLEINLTTLKNMDMRQMMIVYMLSYNVVTI